MSLADQIPAKLDAGSLVGPLQSGLDGHINDVGSINMSIDPSVASGAGDHAQAAAPSGFGPAIAEIVERMAPLLERLPIAGDVLGPVQSSLDTFESIATGKLLTDITGAVGAIEAEVNGTGDGLPALLLRIMDLLGGNPATAGVADLAKALFRAVGAPQLPGQIGQVRDVVAALDSTSRLLGGEMCLESVLAEGERLTSLVARQLDATDIARLVAAADATAGTDGSLAAFVRSLDPDQPADVEAALAAIANARSAVTRLVDGIATGMGLGEATLLYLDVDTMQQEVDRGLAMIGNADVAPTKRIVDAGMAWLQPLLAKINLDAVPNLTLDALLTQIEGAIAKVATGISSIDTAGAVKPLADILAKLADVARTVADALEAVVNDVKMAIGAIRDVVAALPIDAIANAIRTVLQPITAALDFLKNAIGALGDAIGDAANAALTVLQTIEKAVDDFVAAVDALFQKVKDFFDGLHLDQVLGQVADKLRAFADLIGRARLQPYFDKAVEVIGTTADVVGALPFDLLPDSMKADVDAAVKPIKDVDIDDFETQIESILQITPDGKFALRDELTTDLASVQAAYDNFVQAIRDNHPRRYLADLDAKLAELGAKIRDVELGVTLAPLRDAVDRVKAAVTGFDLVAELEPVQAVFRKILDAIDQYNPARLLQPVEQRLDQLRNQFVATLKIDRWVSTLTGLRDQAFAKIDALDPANQTARLQALLGSARDALAKVQTGSVVAPLGHIVCMMLSGMQLRLYPDSFGPVVTWLRGGSANAALAAHTQAIGDAVAATQASVTSLDLGAIGLRFGTAAADLQSAIDAIPAGDAHDRLALAVADYAPQASFLSLAANQSRYVALLADAASAADMLRRAGFSVAEDGITRLRDAMSSAHTFTDIGKTVLGKVGIHDLDRGLAGVADDVLAVATPARLAGLGTPIVAAVRDRLRALVDAVLAPLLDGAHQVERAVATIDLKPIVDAIQGVIDEAKQQLEQLSPLTLLADPITAFEGVQAAVAAFDPFGPILHVLDELKATIRRLVGDPPEVTTDRVEGKLTAERLLAVPLAIVDEFIADLAALDLQNMLNPVFDALDVLAQDVDTGLDKTATAFKRLQAALPGDDDSGGDASGSASIGAN